MPEFFVAQLRPLLKRPPFAELAPKPEFTMLGRTYTIGYEPDPEETLLRRPVERITNPNWPWAIWYPLRRAGSFERLSAEEQGVILKEHGGVGMAFGRADSRPRHSVGVPRAEQGGQRLRHRLSRPAIASAFGAGATDAQDAANVPAPGKARAILHWPGDLAIRIREPGPSHHGSDPVTAPEPTSRLLRACRGLPVDRTPIWLMRQAGRYMEEYRAIRARKTMLELIDSPELAAEITLQPLAQFDFDAAILFADILPPLRGMGLELIYAQGDGPVFQTR